MKKNLNFHSPEKQELLSQVLLKDKKSPKKKDYQKVQIMIRIRPILQNESPDNFIELLENHTLKINKPGHTSYMKFANIFPDTTTQPQIYEEFSEIVNNFLSGVDNIIFAYGQTGAGKTFTVIGNCPEEVKSLEDDNDMNFLSGDDRGILPRCLEQILMSLEENTSLVQYHLWISFFEIYNEKIFDLLNSQSFSKTNGLEIRKTQFGDNQISDLSYIKVTNLEEVYCYLLMGLNNRVTGSTKANAQSSRSHTIFQIVLTQVLNNQITKTSTLKLVDLAGSEKFQIPKSLSKEEYDMRISELTTINGSLTNLGLCISALIDKSRTHIPFRNSKLTRVLSDSLCGEGKVYFIICVSPSLSSCAETISTLQFANRAKRALLDGRHIEDKNQKSMKSYEELLVAYQKEKALRIEYEKLLISKNVDVQKIKEVQECQEEIQALKQIIHQLQSNQQEQLNNQSFSQQQPKQNTATKIQKSERSSEKHVHFVPQSMTEKQQHELDYKDISEIKKLSIYQDLKKEQQDQRAQQVQQLNEQFQLRFNSAETNENALRMKQFWLNTEDSIVIDTIEQLSQINLEKNKLLQKIKQKEIEKKMQDFFTLNSPNEQIRQNDSKISISDSNQIQQYHIINPNTKGEYDQELNKSFEESKLTEELPQALPQFLGESKKNSNEFSIISKKENNYIATGPSMQSSFWDQDQSKKLFDQNYLVQNQNQTILQPIQSNKYNKQIEEQNSEKEMKFGISSINFSKQSFDKELLTKSIEKLDVIQQKIVDGLQNEINLATTSLQLLQKRDNEINQTKKF